MAIQVGPPTQSFIQIEKCISYQVLQAKGQIPGARKGLKMINLDRSQVMLMGGIGVEVYNDIKVFDFSTREWKNIEAINTDVIFIPEPRFGHSMNLWNNHLVLMGGIGEQIPKMKSRKAFSDLRLFSIDRQEWVQQDFSRDGKQENKKRANHAAAVMGACLSFTEDSTQMKTTYTTKSKYSTFNTKNGPSGKSKGPNLRKRNDMLKQIRSTRVKIIPATSNSIQ